MSRSRFVFAVHSSALLSHRKTESLKCVAFFVAGRLTWVLSDAADPITVSYAKRSDQLKGIRNLSDDLNFSCTNFDFYQLEKSDFDFSNWKNKTYHS